MAAEIDAVLKLIQAIGVSATVALCGFAWGFWERRENRAMSAKLMELATAQIEAAYKQEAALTALKAEFK